MTKETQAIKSDIAQLVEDARALMAATADVAGEKVVSARERLAEAIERGGQLYGKVREKATEGVKVADVALHENLYKTVAAAVGMGALVGFLLGRALK